MTIEETITKDIKTLMAKYGAKHIYKDVITKLNRDEYYYCFNEMNGMTVGLINACLMGYDDSIVDSQVDCLFKASSFKGWEELLGLVIYQMKKCNMGHLYDIISSLMRESNE